MRKTAHVLLVALLMVVSYQAARACCVDDPDMGLDEKVRRAVKQADFVFVGKVVAFEYGKDLDDDGIRQLITRNPGTDAKIVKFSVNTWWRGPLGQEVSMVGNEYRSGGKDYGVSPLSQGFALGKTYLVFASRRGEFIGNIACSFTREVDSVYSGEVLALLGPGMSGQ